MVSGCVNSGIQYRHADELWLLWISYVVAPAHYSISVCIPTRERGNEK
jgi:hypothetical protein